MKRSMLWITAAVWVLGISPVFAQESLTNDSVIKLVKAGLSEDLIVQMVNSQPGALPFLS